MLILTAKASYGIASLGFRKMYVTGNKGDRIMDGYNNPPDNV
jgi:hypothetical protein